MNLKFYSLRMLVLFFIIGVGKVYSDHDRTDGSPITVQLETLTVIGDKATENAELGGTPVNELPINVYVVNQKEIERLRFVDPDELLDRIPGETQVRNLRIPDGGKGYTIPTVDGLPLESPYEGATQRLDRVNTSDIQRVEVIKGPASAIYPSNAFGGVINVVTREAPLDPETQVWLEAGEFGRQRAGLNAGGTMNNIGYFIDLNTRNLEGLRQGVEDDRDQLSGKFIYDPSDNTRIITGVEYLDEFVVTRGDLTAEQIADDPGQRGPDSSSEDLQQQSLSFKWEQLVANGMVDFSLSYREKDTIGTSRFRGPQEENDVGISSKLLYRYDFSRSNIVGGFETYRGDQAVNQFARGDDDLLGPFSIIDNTLDIRAYFLQYQTDITQRLALSLGARYEDIDIGSHSNDADDASGSASFSDVSPKFGLTYDLSPANKLWFGISEGFYAPGIDAIFGTPNEVSTENLHLQPEQSTNIEIGIRGRKGHWSYDSAYYHNKVKNYLVEQEFSNGGVAVERTTNAGQITVQGLESVIEYAPKNAHWRAGLTHTYARNKYDAFASSDGNFSGNELHRSPRHHANVRIAWLPQRQWTVELEGDFYSRYYSDVANSPAGRFQRDERINLRVNYEEGPLTLWLHALNLSNTYEDRATYRSSRSRLEFRTVDGRTFYVGMAYHF